MKNCRDYSAAAVRGKFCVENNFNSFTLDTIDFRDRLAKKRSSKPKIFRITDDKRIVAPVG